MKYIVYFALIVFAVSCKINEPEIFKVKPVIVENVSYFSFDIKGEIDASLLSPEPDKFGFIISKSKDYSAISKTIEVGPGVSASNKSNFKFSYINNVAGETFYVKAYASIKGCVIYGESVEVKLKNPDLPVILTKDAREITDSSTIIGGSLIDDGGSSIMELGVVYNINEFSVYPKNKILISGKRDFDIYFNDLKPNTKYFYRAFAKNNLGLTFGAEKSFITPIKLPKVETINAFNIFSSSATFGLNILNNGGGSIIEKGILISTNSKPTFSDINLRCEINNDCQSLIQENLKPETIYYYVAYCRNEAGYVFGVIKSFKTSKPNLITSITVNHNVLNGVAPVSKKIVYGVYTSFASGNPKMWIIQNLGAERVGLTVDEKNVISSGWYFQFNRKQGFQSDMFSRIPNSPWISTIQEDSNWLIVNDPCRIELGGKWRLPTISELSEERNAWNGEAFLSPLKIISSAYLSSSSGDLSQWGISGNYWSSTQKSPSIGWYLGGGGPSYYDRSDVKALAFPCRCVSDN